MVVSYNHDRYIKQTIDSILNQTYKNIELIVFDNHSSDVTDQFLRDYSEKYGFSYIRSDLNLGVSGALNQMLLMANGDYLSVIASDDWMASEKIEKQLKLLKEKGADAVYSPLIKYFDNKGEMIYENGD